MLKYLPSPLSCFKKKGKNEGFPPCPFCNFDVMNFRDPLSSSPIRQVHKIQLSSLGFLLSLARFGPESVSFFPHMKSEIL